ncbi:uncharacterized protein LOC112198776 [Rosa chinensis]|uniref:uncharacterized protein LOC112198776 n=1 Tax=Rosa chinensis TaxID=74649 RepID=UPI000D08E97A|nr:uncharacterized protein LOC112198776 [Rosa chinensis]
MAIWKTRNKLCFNNKRPSLMRVFRSIKSWLRFAAPHLPGYSRGVLDSQLLVSLGIQPVSRKSIAPRFVLWHPPNFPWIKLNTDGLAKGNPGPAACGGVFRVANGQYFGGYCQGLGQHSAFYAELMGVIIGIEIAFRMGWHCIWLESDSMSVLACNSVADRLTNLGLASSSLIWHASPPPEISPYLRMDDQGFPYSRVSS